MEHRLHYQVRRARRLWRATCACGRRTCPPNERPRSAIPPLTAVEEAIRRTYAWNSSIAWNVSTGALRQIRDHLRSTP